ncbi:hypothetical protein [Sinorhizobium meliloti]|uniref:hypothetical protein n=1 Tax=Rhizobium meliloti TaxID=382 RepID=UPI000FE0283F|nr:hypothetical protein [Sinorhizobium meliloti]RVG70914.1 hypothetical protein CN222_01900 [Sinorhizobium meliloti]
MSDSVSEKDFRDIVREIATLSANLQHFMDRHSGMKSDIDALKADLSSVRSDVAEIKAQRSAAIAYISALTTAAGVAWILIGEKIKKIFGF